MPYCNKTRSQSPSPVDLNCLPEVLLQLPHAVGQIGAELAAIVGRVKMTVKVGRGMEVGDVGFAVGDKVPNFVRFQIFQISFRDHTEQQKPF